MPTSPQSNLTRRSLFTWIATAAVLGSVSQGYANGSKGRGGIDPSDRVPRHYSIKRFTKLSQPEIYKINHAIRNGRRITIQGYSPSETRQIVRDATRDWPKTRDSLRTAQN